jgi:hypothetical protein
MPWGHDLWTAESQVRDGRTLHSYLDRIYKEAVVKLLTGILMKIYLKILMK